MSSADRRGAIGASANWLRTRPRRYGFALVVVAVAALVRYGLNVTPGPFPPFVIFLPAVIVAAVLAGFGPGVFATLLSAAAVAEFFSASLIAFGANRTREMVGLFAFCGVGTIISALARLYRLHESRLLEFERVVEGVEDMIVVVDRDYRYLLANRAFLNFRGMKLPGSLRRWGAGDRTDDGDQHTKRKQAEEAVLKSEEHFRGLVEQASEGILLADANGKYVDVNSAGAEMLGYTRDEILNLSIADIVSADDIARISPEVARFGGGAIIRSEWTFRRSEGSCVECNGTHKIPRPAGKCAGLRDDVFR